MRQNSLTGKFRPDEPSERSTAAANDKQPKINGGYFYRPKSKRKEREKKNGPEKEKRSLFAAVMIIFLAAVTAERSDQPPLIVVCIFNGAYFWAGAKIMPAAED